MIVALEGIFMIDLDILEVHVGHKEVVFINDAIEGIAERQVINVTHTRANAARVAVVIGGVRHVISGEWSDIEEELHGHALVPALRQQQTIGEAAVRLANVQREFVFAIKGHHDVVIQFSISGAILDGPGEIVSAALDAVLANNNLINEFIQFHEVFTVISQGDEFAVFVDLGAQEHANDNLLSLIRFNFKGEIEWLVVQTHLTSKQSLIPNEFAIYKLELIIHQVADIKVHQIEVGYQVADLNVGDLNSREGQLFVSVRSQMVLEAIEDIGNLLVEHVEHGIAHHGLEVQEHMRIDLKVGIINMAEVHMRKNIPVAEEVFVEGVNIALQIIANVLNGFGFAQINELAIVGVIETGINHIVDALEGAVDLIEHIKVGISGHFVVVLAVAEANTVVGHQLGIIAVFDFMIPAEFGNFAKAMRQTFHVVARQQLLHIVDPVFTTTILAQTEVLAVQEESIVHVEVVPVGIPVQIFGKVRQARVFVEVLHIAGVVHGHVEGLHAAEHGVPLGILIEFIDVVAQNVLVNAVPVFTQAHQLPPLPGLEVLDIEVVAAEVLVVLVEDIVEFLFVLAVLAPGIEIEFLSFVHEFAVEEVLREDFIDGRQDQAIEVITMNDGQSQGIDEHAFVDMNACPGNVLLEGLPVLGVVEVVEETPGLIVVGLDQSAKELTLGQKGAHLVGFVEFLHVHVILLWGVEYFC